MSEFKTPAGKLVQGMLTMQQRKDITTKQPVWKDAAKTIPDMGTFFSLAFPKSIGGGAPTYTVRPDLAAQGHTMATLVAHGTPQQLVAQGYLIASGGGNPEWDAFHAQLKQEAATSWPALFPQGASGGCTNPRFSWKIQDGDGVDYQGQSVASKPGFAGHWVVKFDTNFPIKVYNEGHFAPHEELQTPEKVVKRGYWVRVMGEMKSNMATGTQVPGISLYPNLVSFLGGNPKDEIVSGPDAQTALGGAVYAGWRPDGISTVPGAPMALPTPGAPAALPLPPTAITAPVVPQYQVRADLAAQGHTMTSLAASGTPEQLLAAGYITVLTPAPAALPLPVPGPVGLPAPGGLPLPTPGLPLPTPGLPAPVAGPTYVLKPEYAAQGVTIEALIGKGWTHDALVQAGHATKIG